METGRSRDAEAERPRVGLGRGGRQADFPCRSHLMETVGRCPPLAPEAHGGGGGGGLTPRGPRVEGHGGCGGGGRGAPGDADDGAEGCVRGRPEGEGAPEAPDRVHLQQRRHALLPRLASATPWESLGMTVHTKIKHMRPPPKNPADLRRGVLHSPPPDSCPAAALVIVSHAAAQRAWAHGE